MKSNKKLILGLISALFCLNSTVASAINPISDFDHKGSVGGGANMKRGNADVDNLSFNASLQSSYDNITNSLTGIASNNKNSDQRSQEYYRITDNLRMDFTDLNYGFGEVDYINDRYAGINYRTAEILGLGHYFIKDEGKLTLAGEIGGGARQTDYIGLTEDENGAVGKVAGRLFWKITDHSEFNQYAAATLGEENTFSESDSSIKTFIADDLYMKFGVNIQNNSDVPVAKKQTDTVTELTFGYQF